MPASMVPARARLKIRLRFLDTMGALSIINGKDDGSFDPKAPVTRAEMAKMITVALNGGVDPVLGTQTPGGVWFWGQVSQERE